jgi:SAM-dependent methyltransferase
MASESYRARLVAEEQNYRGCINVHDLPSIFHYWADSYIRPMLEPFGFGNQPEFFTKYLSEQCTGSNGFKRFASVGCGNGDLEIDLALRFRAAGHSRFVIDCLDLNDAMLERGRAAAAASGVSAQLNFAQADLNEWRPSHEYDAIVANQFLHHVVNLEGLFAAIKNCLQPNGCLLISDMIGRNGHKRWPEALTIVREFWQQLPPSYRYNRQLSRYERVFMVWDCSGEGFEGIRCQDILPLLLAHFQFRFFVGFGNVIDPFVDRSFGYNFDAAQDWDRAFIDRVHQRDEHEMRAGRIKPTHMLAVVGRSADRLAIRDRMTPEFCVRVPEDVTDPPAEDASFSDWNSWPHSPEEEFEIAYRKLSDSERYAAALEEQAARLPRPHAEFEARTQWALRLEAQLADLQKEFEKRTNWALRLDRELQEERAKIDDLKRRPWRVLARLLSRKH